jgi:hypothetical protein
MQIFLISRFKRDIEAGEHGFRLRLKLIDGMMAPVDQQVGTMFNTLRMLERFRPKKVEH